MFAVGFTIIIVFSADFYEFTEYMRRELNRVDKILGLKILVKDFFKLNL